MNVRTSVTLAILLSVYLITPAWAAAGTREQLQSLGVALAGSGQQEQATKLEASLSQTPDDVLDEVYGSIDLEPLEQAFRKATEQKAKLRAERSAVEGTLERAHVEARAEDRANPQSGSSNLNDEFPQAEYPSQTACPYLTISAYDNQTPPQTLIDQTVLAQTLGDYQKVVSTLLKAATAVWDAANRTCQQVEGVIVLGEGVVINLSLACIPSDELLLAATILVDEAGVEIAILDSYLSFLETCDSLADSSRILANYKRLGALNEFLIEFKDDVDTRLHLITEKLDLALQIALENDLHRGSGTRTNVNYTTRLVSPAESLEGTPLPGVMTVCETAQNAIDDAAALGYAVVPKAQAAHDRGVQLIPTDPKKAFESCKDSFRQATRRSNHLQ